MALDAVRARACMRRAIDVSRNSRPEDGRPHPSVGAVLSDLDGNVLMEAARGEVEPGLHAEAGLIVRARQQGIDLRETALFSTLEPCTWRSRKHVPCALQVHNAGIPLVYFGMIDPDLRVCGRGEAFLSMYVTVERFPWELRREIAALNTQFLASKQPALDWTVRTYDIDPAPSDRPRLSILHMSQDLIVDSSGEVWISAGDLSWLKELQPALLRASLDDRPVRILVNGDISASLEQAALSVGASIAHAKTPWALRATIVGPQTDYTEVLILEPSDARKLGCPEDQTLIRTLCQAFEERWREERKGSVSIRELKPSFLIDALKHHVPQYADATVEFRSVAIHNLRPLPASLEEFKIARWDLLSRTIELHRLPEYFAIRRSPWACTPPVFEKYPDGMHVIIDGAHRVCSSLDRGKTTTRAIVVSMPSFDSVPATPRGGWDEVQRKYEQVPRDERYLNYKHAEFRNIREAFRLAVEGTNV